MNADGEPGHQVRRLTAYPVIVDDRVKLVAWCKHCSALHLHELRLGLHDAACTSADSPLRPSGYILEMGALPDDWPGITPIQLHARE